MTLHSISRHFPAGVTKAFLAQFKPLADNDLPDPDDLSAWWIKVERALMSIDASFTWEALHDPAQFGADEVAVLGPHIVGARGWQ